MPLLVDRVERIQMMRLNGRYGRDGATSICKHSVAEDFSEIPGTRTLWAELPYVAADPSIRHLEDLLLRRVRVGLLLPRGGAEHFSRIKSLTLSVLGWPDDRWERECAAYTTVWERLHQISF
jgi:glycerol-3-phosphate dehydrogenase